MRVTNAQSAHKGEGRTNKEHETWVQGHHTQTQGRHASIKQTRQHMGDEEYNETANRRARNKYRHACIKTRLLLGIAKNKESKTKGKSNMTGMH